MPWHFLPEGSLWVTKISRNRRPQNGVLYIVEIFADLRRVFLAYLEAHNLIIENNCFKFHVPYFPMWVGAISAALSTRGSTEHQKMVSPLASWMPYGRLWSPYVKGRGAY